MRILRWLPRPPISARYWPRIFNVSAITLLSGPFQVYESMRLQKKMRHTQIHESPVFIIGHWRSGTTFLHNLLSQDVQFGYVNTIQSIFPHSYLTNPLFPYLTKLLMPSTRPMDEMRLFMQSPQEEEMALVNYGPYSFYHAWHFPRHIRTFYRQMVRLDSLSDEARAQWQHRYLELLKKTTLENDGKRLLLKSPTNTARIRVLLELFPKARFIFIYRDPLEVYPSTKKLYRNVLPVFQLQSYDFEQVRKDILWIYRDLMQTYLKEKTLIPEGQLYEIAYPDLVNAPLSHLKNMYNQLHLGDFAQTRSRFENYLEQRRVKTYRKSEYDLPDWEKEEVKKAWDFAFQTWA